MVNVAPQSPGNQIHHANHSTEKEFADFNLKLKFLLSENGNSRIYPRGVYEIQVADWSGKSADALGAGAPYSRLTPASNPSKAPGE